MYTPPTRRNSTVSSRRRRRCVLGITCIMPNTHRRRDSAVQLSRVGGVNAPVGSPGPVHNFLRCWAIKVGDKWRHNNVTVDKVINIDQSSRIQTAMESRQSVSKLSTESVGSRRELFCELRSHRRRRRDSTRQLVTVNSVSPETFWRTKQRNDGEQWINLILYENWNNGQRIFPFAGYCILWISYAVLYEIVLLEKL